MSTNRNVCIPLLCALGWNNKVELKVAACIEKFTLLFITIVYDITSSHFCLFLCEDVTLPHADGLTASNLWFNLHPIYFMVE